VASHIAVLDGLELPAHLGGHPVLDFCNTLAGWDVDDPRDYLASYDHLAVWTGFSGLLDAGRVAELRRQAARPDSGASRALDDARALRARLYDVLSRDAVPPDVAGVADDVASAAARMRLCRAEGAIRWEVDRESGLAAPLHAVAWAAADLLTSTASSCVRACPGHACGWLFLDLRGRRRWCTMATCGNRAKVKRFAERHRGVGD
jgi:predicted RNA-binding Zn ribbon-like protein